MNRTKRLYILLGALAAVCAVTIGVMELEQHQEKIKNTDEIVLEVDTTTLTTLSWDYEGETLSFHKEDGHWIYDGDEAFPVDDTKIDAMTEQFAALGATFIIEDVEDFSQYGLSSPTCSIHMETDSESYDITLGAFSEMDSQRYVSTGDGNVYLVQNDPMEDFDAELSELIHHDETPDYETVTSLAFSGKENWSLTYSEDGGNTYRTDDVYFTEQSGETIPLDPLLVESYASSLEYLSLTDYVTYNATEEELIAYGLYDPELTITMEYTYLDENEEEQADTFTLHIARDPEEQAKAAEKDADSSEEGDETEEITAYARVGDSPIVYQITGGDYELLMAASYNDFRHKEVIPADLADVSEMTFTLEGQQYTITAEGKDDKRTYHYGEEELEADALVTALENLMADSFTDETPTEKKEISFTVTLSLEGSPQVTVDLYRYDGAHCLAVIDGESVSLVPRDAVVDLIEAINAIVLQ